MFLCEDCVEKEYEIRDDIPLEALPRSYGSCGNCGEHKICYDLPHGTWKKRRNEEEEAMEITKNIKLNATRNLELKAVLTEYLRKNNFDDLLAIIAGLAREHGQHFTFYRAR